MMFLSLIIEKIEEEWACHSTDRLPQKPAMQGEGGMRMDVAAHLVDNGDNYTIFQKAEQGFLRENIVRCW
ncbi:MAG: hypothetical protein JZU65_15955 [Chlorobium sp.]|nr:hypothetical protein [Chlorobium sp.]